MLKLTGLNPVKETEGLMGACSGKKRKREKWTETQKQIKIDAKLQKKKKR